VRYTSGSLAPTSLPLRLWGLYPHDGGTHRSPFLPPGTIPNLDEQRRLEKWVAEQTGADSVKYNSIDAFVAALQMDRQSLCLKCWDGIRPNAPR